MPNKRLEELFEKFLGEKMSADEVRLLQQLVQDENNTEALDKLLKAVYTNPSYSVKGDYNLDEVFEELMIKAKPAENDSIPVIPVNYQKRSRWWLVAACTVLVSAVVYFIGFNKAPKQAIAVQSPKPNNPILPGSNRATLTLSNGSTIFLDEANNGTLAQQGDTKIIKSGNGNLVYDPGNTSGGEVVYNTLSTPRGGQYEVVLPDGTRVWLNAETSLKFPTVFSGNTREVELKGEAYFEVAKNGTMPFIVSIGRGRITVTGTHFNVNGYEDEKNILTTLLEGSIQFGDGTTERTLHPGQQAVYGSATNSLTLRDADVNQVIGWKNGFFEFDNVELSAILRQISRWYDVDIKYHSKGEDVKFGGGISRKLQLTEVLRLLETNEIHFKIEGRNIIVNP